MNVQHPIALLLCLFAAACGTTTPEVTAEPTLVYPILANRADRIALGALRPEFGAETIQRVTAPHMGYKATTVAENDTFAVTVFRIAARGQRRSGATVPGFYFEVEHSGSSEATMAAVKRIRTRLLATVQREAGGLPIAK